MQEWERALQKQAEQKETHMREEYEEKLRQLKQTMKNEFEDKFEKGRLLREVDTMQQLRREMKEVQSRKLATQKAELEASSAEREKVLDDALQNASKKLTDSREYGQQLEQRLAEEVAMKEKAEQQFEKEKKQYANLRDEHKQQQKVLQRSLSLLRSFGSSLTDVRDFLITLAGTWQTFSCQFQQQSAQVVSGIRHDLAHSAGELQKMTLEKERLSLQLMEQMRQSEEQLALHKNSEMDYKATVLRVKSELERTHEEWLSSQRRCDTLQELLSTWQQRLEQTSGKYHAAEEEVTGLKEALERAERDARDVRRDRDMLTESHQRALDKLKDDYQNNLALKLNEALEKQRLDHVAQLQQQMSEVHRETRLELHIHSEKNRALHLQYQRDSARLQQKLAERDQQVERLQTELEEYRRSREEERKSEEHQNRRQEEKIQEERDMWRQQLHQAQTELQTITKSNQRLEQEVAVLEETVRRECEEREELTTALSRAQEQLVALHSPSPHHTSKTRVPLSRSSTPPNTLRYSPHTGRGQGRGPGAAVSRDSGEGRGKKGSLPSIAEGRTDGVMQKIGLVMRLNEMNK
ncbi:protein LEKR1 [Periophthalmus magnuspinnatus]|uniref:protein LEKR1 n=1 Tax=Periophthalmus magnuspinnatus TaxID=409849 RepID=UPI0024369D5A|nr:protein LEKR1 [Periophthalmus magnuspinnatus]